MSDPYYFADRMPHPSVVPGPDRRPLHVRALERHLSAETRLAGADAARVQCAHAPDASVRDEGACDPDECGRHHGHSVSAQPKFGARRCGRDVQRWLAKSRPIRAAAAVARHFRGMDQSGSRGLRVRVAGDGAAPLVCARRGLRRSDGGRSVGYDQDADGLLVPVSGVGRVRERVGVVRRSGALSVRLR